MRGDTPLAILLFAMETQESIGHQAARGFHASSATCVADFQTGAAPEKTTWFNHVVWEKSMGRSATNPIIMYFVVV